MFFYKVCILTLLSQVGSAQECLSEWVASPEFIPPILPDFGSDIEPVRAEIVDGLLFLNNCTAAPPTSLQLCATPDTNPAPLGDPEICGTPSQIPATGSLDEGYVFSIANLYPSCGYTFDVCAAAGVVLPLPQRIPVGMYPVQVQYSDANTAAITTTSITVNSKDTWNVLVNDYLYTIIDTETGFSWETPELVTNSLLASYTFGLTIPLRAAHAYQACVQGEQNGVLSHGSLTETDCFDVSDTINCFGCTHPVYTRFDTTAVQWDIREVIFTQTAIQFTMRDASNDPKNVIYTASLSCGICGDTENVTQACASISTPGSDVVTPAGTVEWVGTINNLESGKCYTLHIETEFNGQIYPEAVPVPFAICTYPSNDLLGSVENATVETATTNSLTYNFDTRPSGTPCPDALGSENLDFNYGLIRVTVSLSGQETTTFLELATLATPAGPAGYSLLLSDLLSAASYSVKVACCTTEVFCFNEVLLPVQETVVVPPTQITTALNGNSPSALTVTITDSVTQDRTNLEYTVTVTQTNYAVVHSGSISALGAACAGLVCVYSVPSPLQPGGQFLTSVTAESLTASSSPVTDIIVNPPVAVSSIMHTATTSSLHITWSDDVNDQAVEYFFKLSEIYTGITPAKSVDLPELTAKTTYQFQVLPQSYGVEPVNSPAFVEVYTAPPAITTSPTISLDAAGNLIVSAEDDNSGQPGMTYEVFTRGYDCFASSCQIPPQEISQFGDFSVPPSDLHPGYGYTSEVVPKFYSTPGINSSTPLLYIAPVPPTINTTSSETGVTWLFLSWSDHSNYPSQGLLYLLSVDITRAAGANETSLSYNFTDLAPNSNYTVVIATIAHDLLSESNSATFLTKPAPEQVTTGGLDWWAWLLISLSIVLVLGLVVLALLYVFKFNDNDKTEPANEMDSPTGRSTPGGNVYIDI